MKKNILFILVAVVIATLSVQCAKKTISATPISTTAISTTNVMSFNIRYDNKNDGENRWENRKDLAIKTVLDNQVDILGMQEVLHNQVLDLQKALPDYERIGVGRDDGIEAGEYSPIFYNSKRFAEVSSGYFWLSQSPMEAGSLGWDAACTRIATWAKLKDLKSGKIIYVLNTHFDHVGKIARAESVKLILEKIDGYTSKDKLPVIVTGDFNATLDSEVVQTLTDESNPLHVKDSRALSPNVKGPAWTFHDFGKRSIERRTLIDYVFVRNNISVLDFEIIEGYLDGRWISDHCPVLVKVRY